MTRRAVALAGLSTLRAGVAAAQDLVYDDGGDHVLSAYGPLGRGSIVEVRDGPGADPTNLDISIGEFFYEVHFRTFDTSTLHSLSLGGAVFDTFDSSTATIEAGSVVGDGHDVNSWDQSQLIVRDVVNFSTANHQATTLFESGAFVDFHSGFDQSSTIMHGGGILNLYLFGSSTMSVLGGHAGQEGTFVSDDAILIVNGGDIHHGDDLLGVSGNGRADIRSGATDTFSTFHYEVSQTGMIRLFGSDFLLDGLPMAPGDITALSGGATNSGSLSGVLESGHAIEVSFSVSGSGIIRIVPEPGTGMLAVLGLALAMGAARRRASALLQGA